MGKVLLVPVVCKWSVRRTHTEMPYTTERTHKVARTQSISQFTLSEMGTAHKWQKREPTC